MIRLTISAQRVLHWVRLLLAGKWMDWIHVSADIWSALDGSAPKQQISSAIYTEFCALGSQLKWGQHWIGSENDVKSLNQSRELRVVSIHNVITHMTSNDVRWRYHLGSYFYCFTGWHWCPYKVGERVMTALVLKRI